MNSDYTGDTEYFFMFGENKYIKYVTKSHLLEYNRKFQHLSYILDSLNLNQTYRSQRLVVFMITGFCRPFDEYCSSDTAVTTPCTSRYNGKVCQSLFKSRFYFHTLGGNRNLLCLYDIEVLEIKKKTSSLF